MPIKMPENNLVITLCRILEGIFTNDVNVGGFHQDRQKKVLTKIFAYSFAWSFGGCIDTRNHSSFEVYLGNAFSTS